MSDRDPLPPLLALLHPAEQSYVLLELLDGHPELREEADEYALEILNDVDVDAVTDEVVDVFMGMDHTLIGQRSGRQPGRGYVHEVDAVWELLEEAIEPFVDEVVRRRRLRLDDAAQRYVQGVLAGLDEVRRTVGEATVFSWGPPDDAASEMSARIRNAAGSDIPAP
jgi:hypothetical protein